MPRTEKERKELQFEILHKLLLHFSTSDELISQILSIPQINVNYCDPKTKVNALSRAFISAGGTPDRKPRIKMLLKAGVDINHQMIGYNFNNTPLHNAIANEDSENAIFTIEICNKLNINLNFNAKDSMGTTLLCMAAKFNQPHVALKILELGGNKVDINEQDNFGNSTLHYAMLLGHILLAEKLLQAGAHISLQNQNSQTPFDMLEATDNDMQQHLVSVHIYPWRDEKARINCFTYPSCGRCLSAVKHTTYPLTKAQVVKEQETTARILKLAKQLNITALNTSNHVFLQIPAMKKNATILKKLTAFPMLVPSSDIITKINWVLPYSPKYKIMSQEDIKRLEKLTDAFTGVPLITRVRENRVKMKLFIKNGAQTILEEKMVRAAMNNDASSLGAIIPHVKHINAKYKGNTALHWAFINSNLACAQLLFNAKADPEVENDIGKKPIDYLKLINVKNVLEILLSNKIYKTNEFVEKETSASKDAKQKLRDSNTNHNQRFCMAVNKVFKEIAFKPNGLETKYLDMLKNALKTNAPYNAIHDIIKKIDEVNRKAFFSTFKYHMQPVRNSIVKLMRIHNQEKSFVKTQSLLSHRHP